MMIEIDPAAPKKRGRKPGGGKVPGSGRKPGVKNRMSSDIREMIHVRGKPVELLCDIARGVKIRVGPQAGPSPPEYVYPTLQERAAAARILVDKILPSATELTGPNGAALVPSITDTDLARLVVYTMAKAGVLDRRDVVRGVPTTADRTTLPEDYRPRFSPVAVPGVA